MTNREKYEAMRALHVRHSYASDDRSFDASVVGQAVRILLDLPEAPSVKVGDFVRGQTSGNIGKVVSVWKSSVVIVRADTSTTEIPYENIIPITHWNTP